MTASRNAVKTVVDGIRVKDKKCNLGIALVGRMHLNNECIY